MKISIIMAIYNAEKYVEKAVRSLLTQTLDDIEIICVNDGSTDNTLNILNNLAQQDNRIKIITQKNQGQSVARNEGLRIATSEYISFLDADDWMENDTLEKLYNNANDADMVIGNICVCKDNEKIYNDNYFSLKIFPEDLTNKTFTYKDCADFIFRISVAPWGKIYKREFLKSYNLKFENGLIFEDNIFFLTAFLHAKSVRLTRDAYVCYRMDSETSCTHGNNDKKKLDILKIMDLEKDLLKEFPEYKEYFEFHKKSTLFYWFKKLTDPKIKLIYWLKLLKNYPMLLVSPVLKPLKTKFQLAKIKKNDYVWLDQGSVSFLENLSGNFSYVSLDVDKKVLKNGKVYKLSEINEKAKIFAITTSYYKYASQVSQKLQALGVDNEVRNIILPLY